MTAILQPAKRLRRVAPRVCGTCAYGELKDSVFECARERGLNSDSGEGWHWLTVCDGYVISANYKNLRNESIRERKR